MSDSERVRELEGRLRVWRRGVLAYVCATLVVGSAGISLAQNVRVRNDVQLQELPAETLTLELPEVKDVGINATTISFNAEDRSLQLTGPKQLRWGNGYQLNVGSAYSARVERLDKQKDGRSLVTFTRSN